MITVTLNPEELRRGYDVGKARIALAPGNPRFAYVKGRSGTDTHTIGALAELAAAKALGLPWPARINTFRQGPDLDPFWEVRWSSNFKRVKIAIDDPPHYLVLHVTGEDPTFDIHGYILASWGQQNVPAVDPGKRGWAAHFVDVYRLSPIDPGFHAICSWIHRPEGWMCVFCGAQFEGKVA